MSLVVLQVVTLIKLTPVGSCGVSSSISVSRGVRHNADDEGLGAVCEYTVK